MAVKYAVANGNWSDGTTWNGGVVPVDGDEVYLDGYQVTANADINTLCTVTNAMNNITGRSGGVIFSNANDRNITISIIALIGVNDYTIPIFKTNLWRNRTITLNCDITGYVIISGGANISGTMAYLVVNGNVKGAMLWDGNNIWGSITVNGNVDNSEAQYAFISATVSQNQSHFINITFNGNINTGNNRLSFRRVLKYVVINGNLTTNSSAPLLTPFITTEDSYCYFNGRLISTNGATLSDNLQKLKIGPLTQMQFPDLTGAPVVLSAYPLVVDYPSESEVKKDVEYAWGEKIGTYLPDYPPESVVLKDYEYGDSDDRKIGTMPVLSQQLISRLENCATVETVQQLLVAHLDN